MPLSALEVREAVEDGLAVLAAGHPITDTWSDVLELESAFAALGITVLLEDLDVARFRRHLCQAAQARCFFLERANRAPETILGEAISRSEAVLAALAAGSWTLARRIESLSRADWFPDAEYEEDFAFTAAVHALVEAHGRVDAAVLTPVLERIAAAVDGAEYARLAVLESLVSGDPGAFERALEDRIEERRATFDIAYPEGRSRIFDAHRCVFVEGLALIELARVRGYDLEPEHALCPSMGRASGEPEPPEDLFEDLARQFGV